MSYMKSASVVSLVVSVSVLALGGCAQKSESTSVPKMQTNTQSKNMAALPSLQAKLDERRESFEQRAPEEVKTLYTSAIENLRASGILDTMIHVGEIAPDFNLPAVGGDSVRLYDQLRKGPVVLAWYRGGWCPFCNLELLALNDAMSYLNDAGATLIAISPEIPDSATNTVTRDSLKFLVVSDAGNRIARRYGIVFTLPKDIVESYRKHFDLTAYNGDHSYELPLPATFVIDTNGVIKFAFADADYRVRAEPSVVVNEVRKLTSPGS